MITTSKPSLITPNLVWGAKYRRKSERNVEVNDVPLGVNTCIFQVIDQMMHISEKLNNHLETSKFEQLGMSVA